MDAKEKAMELMSGLDKETLNAVANFGDSYINFLWWRDIFKPFLTTGFVALIMAGLIFFTIVIFKTLNEEDKNK